MSPPHKPKDGAWRQEAPESTRRNSPLDDGFVVQLPGRGLHDGKLLPRHQTKRWILHGGSDGADEVWQDAIRGQDGKGAHGIHGRLPEKPDTGEGLGWH